MGGWEGLYSTLSGGQVCPRRLAPPQSPRRETEGGTAGDFPQKNLPVKAFMAGSSQKEASLFEK